jgi:hypothetical protein
VKIATLSVVICSVSAVLADKPSGFHAADGEINHQRFMSRVSLAEIHPKWSPDSRETPPLSPGRAQAIARKQLEYVVPSGQKWYVEAIRIIDGHEHRDWLYEIAFRREYPSNVTVFDGDRMNILVLMDGTPVKPKRIP